LALAASMQRFANELRAKRFAEYRRRQALWARKPFEDGDDLIIKWVTRDRDKGWDVREFLSQDWVADQIGEHEHRVRAPLPKKGAVKTASEDFLQRLKKAMKEKPGRGKRHTKHLLPMPLMIRLGLEYDRVYDALDAATAEKQLLDCMQNDLEVVYGADLIVRSAHGGIVLNVHDGAAEGTLHLGEQDAERPATACAPTEGANELQPIAEMWATGGEKIVFSFHDMLRLLEWWEEFKRDYVKSSHWKPLSSRLYKYIRVT
jgi:hypothetical protein